MTILIIVLLVLLLAGGGYGYNSGYLGANPLGVVLLVVLILLLAGLLGGPRFGWW